MQSPATDPFVTGLLLGAGGSSRLGQPKQLLPYRETTLLGHVVGTARGCGFHQIVVAIGGAADEVRAKVDLAGTDVVVNDAYGAGCSSSIAAALGIVDPRCEVIVLMTISSPRPAFTILTMVSLVSADCPKVITPRPTASSHNRNDLRISTPYPD